MSKRIAIASGVATAQLNGHIENTDVAKGSEVTSPDLTSPDLILGLARSIHSSSSVMATSGEARQPEPRIGWMGAARFEGGVR